MLGNCKENQALKKAIAILVGAAIAVTIWSIIEIIFR